jgi:hypothetical protein
MSRVRFGTGLWFVLALCAPCATRADIFALSYNEALDAVEVRDSISGAATGGRVPSCCAIPSGATTYDAANNRAYFVRQSGVNASIVTYNYIAGTFREVAVSAGFRVTHLEWDAVGARLFALAIDSATEALVMAQINPVSGTLTVRATMTAPCCVLRSGVSALTTSGGTRMFAVGMAGGAEQILIFNFDTNTGPATATIPAGFSIAELVVHPQSGALFGLAHDSSAESTRLITVGTSAPFTVTPIGAGASDCCFVLAGPAAIDAAGNRLVALGAAFGATATSVRSYNLATGVPSNGIGLTGFALFEDTGISTGVLFSDGFESVVR